MKVVLIVSAFAAGLAAVIVLAIVKKFKAGTVVGFAANSVVGAVVLVALTLSNTVILPINPFNALLTGALGVPGLAAVFLFARFL